MNKKYCVVSDTYFIKGCVRPYNIQYTFCGDSLDHPHSKLDFEFEFTEDFFRHIRFYEVTFNEKELPVSLHPLKSDEESIDLPNGWLSLNGYFDKINYHFSLFKIHEQWYESNIELWKALLQWGREVAEQRIRETIIDSIENKEEEK